MFELHRYWWDLHLSGIFIVYKIFPISCSVCFSNWTMGRHLRPGTGANIHKSYSGTRPPTQHHHCCWAAVAVVTTLYSWILIPALEITSPLLNWWHSVRRWLGLWVANSEAQTSDQQKQIEIKSQNTFPKSKIPKVLHWNTLFLRYLFQNSILCTIKFCSVIDICTSMWCVRYLQVLAGLVQHVTLSRGLCNCNNCVTSHSFFSSSGACVLMTSITQHVIVTKHLSISV